MVFSITKISQGPVVPSEPTPGGNLPLSWIDRYPTHRGLVESLHVFPHGHQPAKAIREALAKALVYYYPLAGRIVETDLGEAQIDCNSGGVWFVEAAADCTLGEVKYLERPLMIPQEDLLPGLHPDLSPKDTIMMMQVTEFKCSGFVIGQKLNHAAVDGSGAVKLMTAVAELTRGLPSPTLTPVWNRHLFPNPTNIKPSPLPDLPLSNFQYSTIDIPLHTINTIKTQTSLACTTFDVIVATVWQAHTRALKLDPYATVRLCFFASTQQLANLGDGYYGNNVFPVKVIAVSRQIVEGSLGEVVGLIREAKWRMKEEFAKWASGELGEDPFEYKESLFVSDWRRLGFDELDYGWGTPVYSGPLTNNEYIASCILLKTPQVEGTRLVTRCVSEDQMLEFNALMTNLGST